MASLNFKHLRYFWAVAKAGSIARASERLHLTPQSISGQISELEESLGVALFRRAGRGLELTDTGQRILGYAEQIFSIGDELLLNLHEEAGRAKSPPFNVGIADSVPKSVAYRVVEPSLSLPEPIRLVCREGRLPTLLADLAVHRLDMVIADRPMPDNLNVRGYDHFLGESGVSVFGTKALAMASERAFPALLDNAPFLLPGSDVALQARLLRWFEEQRLSPRIVGEFDDSALIQAFGQAGAGFFVAPTAIEAYVSRQFDVTVVGRIDAVREQLFAITNERKLSNPIVMSICNRARQEMFGAPKEAAAIASDRGRRRKRPAIEVTR